MEELDLRIINFLSKNEGILKNLKFFKQERLGELEYQFFWEDLDNSTHLINFYSINNKYFMYDNDDLNEKFYLRIVCDDCGKMVIIDSVNKVFEIIDYLVENKYK